MLFPNLWLNLASVIWFISLWLGYARIAHYQARRINCLASSMHGLRVSWITQLLSRENRVADSSIIANIERNVAFMASTSILVLAGIVTALASTEDLYALLSELHVAGVNSYEEIQLKLGALALIFIYAFFTFTWSLRQFGFCSVIVGATPDLDDFSGDVDTDAFIKHGAKVLDQAAHSFNFGLRAFYFAVATLAWFIHPIAFMASVTVVIWVLYHREFRSTTMRALISVNKDLEALSKGNTR